MSAERETEDLDAARSRIDTELRAELAMAMANGDGNLRRPMLKDADGRSLIVEMPLTLCLRDLIDTCKQGETESVLMRAFIKVLQHSECPEVQAWRLLAMSQYAAEHTNDIAEMQCQEGF